MNKTQAKKIEVLSKVKLPQDARTLLNKIEKALQGGNSDAKEKANTALDNLFNKVKEVAAKQQSEDKGEKVSPKTVTPKSSDIDEPEQKEEISKVANAVVDPLMEAINNDPSLKGFNPKATDVLRDSSRPAMSRGRRVSRKGWKNQYGESAGGRVYYETRENRMDRKAPISKNTKMPWLEHGGHLEGDGFEVVEIMDGNETIILSNQSLNDAKVVAMAKRHMGDNGDYLVRDSMGNIFYSSNPSMFKVGGYMAEGGSLDERKEYFQGTMSNDSIKSILDYEYPNNRFTVEYNSIDGTRVYAQHPELLKAQDKLKDTYKIKTTLKGVDEFGMPYLAVPSQFVFFAKGGYMEHGGVVGEKFTISAMREKLGSMFPDSFGFTVGTISPQGNKNVNSSALITNPNDPFRGLKDEDINSKLFFPQYKKLHDIRFRIYQGGENTYFYFNLESTDGDEYVGQFGFKDEGDVPSSYITRFIAFLMEQYGLPFEVNHSVMAKGGMTDHNLMIGDTIKQSFGNILVVENDGKTYLVNINTGQRWTDSEWWSLSKGEITKYTKMAKGGNVYSSDDAYEAIILKDGVEVDRVVLRAKNKGEARMMYEDYHEGKMMKTHGEDITYEIIVAPSKMAKGGVVYTDLNDIPNLMDRVERGYVTYRGLGAFKEGTEITVDGKKYIVTDDDFNSIARDKDGNMRIRFSAPSRKRYEDGGYMAMGGELTKVDVKSFKKGDKIKISYGSSISRNNEVTLMVKNITLVNKGKSNEKEKITFINLDNPTGVKYYAYISTNSDYVGFAIGDMAISNVKLINHYAKGGSIGFEGLSKKVASNYEGKEVPKKYQSEYGKTYSKEEAKEVGDKVAAKVYRQQMGKMEKGGKIEDAAYLVRMAEEYAEREYEKPVKKGVGTTKATKLGENKYKYTEVTVFFKDGTTHTFMQEDFEEFFDVDDYAKGGELQKGIRVEMKEHGMSRAKATKTALDHLKENPKYYTKMEESGLESGGEVEFFDYSNADLDKLPVGLTKYFNKPKGTITIEMSKIVPTRAREKGVKNANKYMLQAYKGEIEKRDPIKVYKQKGKYYVQDGNSTYANAKFSGWKTIYATVVKNPKLVEVSKNRQGNVLSLAKEIRQVGESWQDAIQRAKKMNK
jgi:hypothetical protein